MEKTNSAPALFSNVSLRKLLVPLVVEQVLVMTVGMVDTVMVASAGEAAVSGVALVDMVNYLIITVMAALTTGGSVIISQYMGSCQSDRAEGSAGQLMAVSAVLSAAILLLCLVGRDGILHLFFGAVEPDVMARPAPTFSLPPAPSHFWASTTPAPHCIGSWARPASPCISLWG